MSKPSKTNGSSRHRRPVLNAWRGRLWTATRAWLRRHGLSPDALPVKSRVLKQRDAYSGGFSLSGRMMRLRPGRLSPRRQAQSGSELTPMLRRGHRGSHKRPLLAPCCAVGDAVPPSRDAGSFVLWSGRLPRLPDTRAGSHLCRGKRHAGPRQG
jgi:hypothetical protein